MKASVLEFEGDSVILSLENGKDIKVPRKRLDFEYDVGDTISIQKKNGKINCAPHKKKKRALKLKIGVTVVATISITAAVIVAVILNNKGQVQDNKTAAVADYANTYQPQEYPTEGTTPVATRPTTRAVSSECLNAARTKAPTQQEVYDTSGSEANYNMMLRIATFYSDQIACYLATEGIDYSGEIAQLQVEYDKYMGYAQEISDTAYNASQNYVAPTPSAPTQQPQAPTCDEYNAQYYAAYQNSAQETMQHYNSAITNARNSCSSFGGCPAARDLEIQRDQKLDSLRSNYESAIRVVGCEPSY